jgi:hypothetical protein
VLPRQNADPIAIETPEELEGGVGLVDQLKERWSER